MPLPTQTLGQTNNLIKQNFNNISTNWQVNHVDWDSGTDSGKHKFVTMPEQGSDPVTAANEMAIYTKAVSGITQMFLRNEGNGAAVNFSGLYTFPGGPWALGSQGSTTLPSGLILKWGFNSVTAGSGTISFALSGSYPTTLFAVFITPSVVTNATVSVNARTLANFTVNCSTASTTSFYWFAIGN